MYVCTTTQKIGCKFHGAVCCWFQVSAVTQRNVFGLNSICAFMFSIPDWWRTGRRGIGYWLSRAVLIATVTTFRDNFVTFKWHSSAPIYSAKSADTDYNSDTSDDWHVSEHWPQTAINWNGDHVYWLCTTAEALLKFSNWLILWAVSNFGGNFDTCWWRPISNPRSIPPMKAQHTRH